MSKDSTTVIRAVTIPVASPVDLDWKQFNAALTPAFRLATDLANWCVHRLFRLDSPGVVLCPDAVRPRSESNPKGSYLYGNAVRAFPEWQTRCDKIASSANCIIQRVQRKYMEDRYDFMFSHDSSLLTYRYPHPFLIHNRDWDVAFEPRSSKIGARVSAEGLSFENNAAPIFTLNLPGKPGVRLRLRQGREFIRQLAMVRMILDGRAKRGEASIVKNRKGDVLVKMVGHFPVRERSDRDREHACLLTTQPHALLCSEIDGRNVTITNGDDLIRVMNVVRALNDRHAKFLQRASEDKKREVRMGRHRRANFNKAIEERCAKQRDRIETAVKQIAEQTARFIGRQRVGVVIYDDSKRQYIRNVNGEQLSFPWHMLASQLKDKLSELGVVCVFPLSASAKEAQKKEYEAWLANPKAMWATALALKRNATHQDRKPGDSHPAVTTRNAM